MARKKFYGAQREEQKKPIFKGWHVAKYIRLSRFDNDDVESCSVQNQRKLIDSFIEEHEEFISSEEFIDDDWTGTNFNRPGFQRMMKAIRSGKINCIILKDLSRFGRNYIEAGKLLEETLPSYGCRIISIIDDVDSFKDADVTMSLMVRIKNLIHDHNSMETSKKVRASKDILRREGKNISPAPFGYKKDPNDKYKLVVDKEPAGVVKMIYDMYLKGMGVIRITQKLNALGIATRQDYFKIGSIYKDNRFEYNKKGWFPMEVRAVLFNMTYTGALDQRRRTTRNYKDRRSVVLEEKDHIIVRDTHEAIIPKEVFDRVQEQFKTRCTGTSLYQDILYPFSGMLRCADCGSSMIRNSTFVKGKKYIYYKCRAFNQRGIQACRRSHSIQECVLTDLVLRTINTHLQTLVDMKRAIDAINQHKDAQPFAFDYDRLIRDKQRQRDELMTMKTNAHMRYFGFMSGDEDIVLKKEDMVAMIKSLDDRIAGLNSQIAALETEKKAEEDIRRNEITWLDRLLGYGYLKELNREITSELIDFIYIGADKKVRIELRYQDEYRQLIRYIEKYAPEFYQSEGNMK
jgi:DNA invertase Pin-like site-specific DNA recombinase